MYTLERAWLLHPRLLLDYCQQLRLPYLEFLSDSVNNRNRKCGSRSCFVTSAAFPARSASACWLHSLAEAKAARYVLLEGLGPLA
jgi:hypothetical protein